MRSFSKKLFCLNASKYHSFKSFKDNSYGYLGANVQLTESPEVVLVGGEKNAQVGGVSTGGPNSVSTKHTDNGGYLLPSRTVDLQYQLLKKRKPLDHLMPANLPSSNPRRPHRCQQPVVSVDHCTLEYLRILRPRTCLVLISLNCSGIRQTRITRQAIQKPMDPEIGGDYWNQLIERPPTSNINGNQEQISKSLQKARTIFCGDTLDSELEHIANVLRANGYPERFITKNMSDRFIQPRITTVGKKPAYLSLPYKGLFTEELPYTGCFHLGLISYTVEEIFSRVMAQYKANFSKSNKYIAGSIPALVLPSDGMAVRHRKDAKAERSDSIRFFNLQQLQMESVLINRCDHSTQLSRYIPRKLCISGRAKLRGRSIQERRLILQSLVQYNGIPGLRVKSLEAQRIKADLQVKRSR
ncbi:hypothetical protein CLF_109326 [Clonorchis sinensis]|uniref:Uncharacterized protein n=1 Tax=Clonorchis sinensis TaxID=79923 RepID=G7YSH4_CLOSI|nr:hypothetical protein CLF_109326 [Clonorchis sinensis]